MIPNVVDPNTVVLRTNNPYAKGFVVDFEDTTFILQRNLLTPQKSPRDRYYTTIDNETIDEVAFVAYGDSKLWWIIADANNLEFPMEIPSGTTLLVPDLDKLKLAQL